MKRFKAVRFLCLVVAMLMALTACSGGTQSADQPTQSEPATQNEQPVDASSIEATTTDTTGAADANTVKMADEQVYRFAMRSTITSFDPHRTGGIPDWQGQAPVYENLVRYVVDASGAASYQPGVATDWSMSDDGLTYTFNLREDAKWADGSDLTAHDFVYSWQRVFDPEVASDYEWFVDGLISGGAEYFSGEGAREDVGVVALNDHTLEIQLTRPCGYFMQIAAFPTYKPVKQAFVEQFEDAYGSSLEKVLGNGPFVLESWEPGLEAVFVPNEHYWDRENVYLDRIERKIVAEENARAQALLTGELDAAGIAEPQWRDMLDAEGGYNYINQAGASVEFFMYNQNNKYLKNTKIRQALSLAFDRERYIVEIMDDFGFTANGVVPPTVHAGEGLYVDVTKGESEIIKNMRKDLTDPKALLVEGLKEEGFSGDPAEMEITMMTRGTGEWIKKSAEWIQQNYEDALGIKFNIEMVPWNVMWDNVDAGTYEIAVGGWTADVDDPTNLIDIFHTKTGYYHEEKLGWAGERAEEFNALIDKSLLETDALKKAELFVAAEKILVGDAVVAPLYFSEKSTYRRENVKNNFSNPFTYQDYKGVFIADN